MLTLNVNNFVQFMHSIQHSLYFFEHTHLQLARSLFVQVVNEKIYIFIWFWFAALFFLLMFVLLYRILILFAWKWRSYFLIKRCTLSFFGDLNYICENGNIGDWFLLYMLGSNLDPLLMRDVTEEMATRMRKDDQLFQEKVLHDQKERLMIGGKSRSFNPLNDFTKKRRAELTDCAGSCADNCVDDCVDRPPPNKARPTAPSLTNAYCVAPIYPAPDYTCGGYALPAAKCRPADRYMANCTDNCPSNHFVTPNRTTRADKLSAHQLHKSDRIHSTSRLDAGKMQQSAVAASENCRQSCCRPIEQDEDYMDENQETLAANHCLKANDECMDRHCSLRQSSISNQSIREVVVRKNAGLSGEQPTANQRRCSNRMIAHDSSSCNNHGSNSSNSSKTGCCRHSSRPLQAACANECCLRSQEHSEICSLASSDVVLEYDDECKLNDSECFGNESSTLAKHSPNGSTPNRTSGYQSNAFSNNSNNSDTLDQVSSLEQTSLDKASLEKRSLGKRSLGKRSLDTALLDELPLDRSILDRTPVDRSLADGSSLDKSLLDRPGRARSNRSHSTCLNSGQLSSADKSLLLTSSRRRLFGDALSRASTLIPFNRTRSERCSSPASSKKGHKGSNKANRRTDLSSSNDGQHDAASDSGSLLQACSRSEHKKSKHRKAKKTDSRPVHAGSVENLDDHVGSPDLAGGHDLRGSSSVGNQNVSTTTANDSSDHRNSNRLFQIKKYLKSKPKRHSSISHHFTSKHDANQHHTIEMDDEDDAPSVSPSVYQRHSSSPGDQLGDQLKSLPVLKSGEQSKK